METLVVLSKIEQRLDTVRAVLGGAQVLRGRWGCRGIDEVASVRVSRAGAASLTFSWDGDELVVIVRCGWG